MEFTNEQWIQLISALAVGLVVFVGAYLAPARLTVGLLIVLAPFQIIGSRFGTLNMVLIYLIGGAHLLRNRVKALPFLGVFLLILFAYLLSMSQTPRATYPDHLFYLVGVGANLVLFYVVYNYVTTMRDSRTPFDMFLWMNFFVLVYCAVQLVTGVERFAFLGVQEFAFAEISLQKMRLLGPFGAAGTNAEVFVLQILLIGYLLLHERPGLRRLIMSGMLLANFAFLIMTGSRGSFLALVGGAALFVWFFRRELGVLRAARVSLVTLAGFAVVTALVLNFTQFDILFDRLARTELRGGLPDTRALAFRLAWERIPEKPMLGHGPRLRLINEQDRRIPGHEPLQYPHNLYLYLLVTVGVVGLAAYLLLFFGFYRWWRRAKRHRSGNAFLDGLPTLATLLLIVFLVDQLKIEFLRARLTDHQQYLFALWATLLGLTGAWRQRRVAPSGPDPAPVAGVRSEG